MNTQPLEVSITVVPDQQMHDGNPFPLAYQCETEEATVSDAVTWAQAHADELLAHLSENGALLFRGFPLASAEDFDAFAQAFNLPSFSYDDSLSNAVRVNYTPRVFSANEAPSEATINLHHEMAQTPIYPSKLFFFCHTAADKGGASSICRSDTLWSQLEESCPEFARACEEKGLKYSHTMTPEEDAQSGQGRSWKSTFGVKTREEVEARMTELGYTWEWLEDDTLRVTSPTLPAVRELTNGRKSFFNQLIAALSWNDSGKDALATVTFGDGSPLDIEGATTAERLAEELIFDVAWQEGDVALVDNYIAMHGRRNFEGKRKLLASFAA